MEKEIKISVIVPVYNASKYLEKCLESIISQSLKEIEIICVNDGSVDNSLEILRKIAKEEKRLVIINKENGGVSSTRNAALKIAKGKYCANIDSDDWIDSDYLKIAYERVEKDNLDILVTDIILERKNKEKEIIIDLAIEDNKILTGLEYINQFYKKNRCGYTWNKLIRLDLYKKNKIFYDEEISLMEDFQLINILGYYAKKVGKINKGYYHYLMGDNNSSRKYSIKNLKDVKKAYEGIIEFYEKKQEFLLVKIVKSDMELHLIERILRGNYDETNEYNDFIKKFVLEIKNEEKNKNNRNKYEVFLTKIINSLKFWDIRYYKIILKIGKNIILLNELKNNLKGKLK